MTAGTAAPALAVLCSCGHAARLHDADGCLRNLCGCSRDRAEAAAQGDSSPLDSTPVPQTVPEPAASLVDDVVSGNAQPPVEPPAAADSAPDSTSPEPVVEPPDFAELARALKAGRGHADPAISALAVRVDGELQALVDMLAAYDAKSDLRARRDQLRAELAQVEAELEGDPTACTVCPRTFVNEHGRNVHEFRAHGIRRGDQA